MQLLFGPKVEPEGEAWLVLQAEKEKKRNKAIIAAIVCLILAILRFSKYEMSIIGIFLAAASVVLLVTSIVLQIQTIDCKRQYAEFAKERDWEEIKKLKSENELLSRNASYFKSEMEKAQAKAQELIADKEKADKELDWQIKRNESQRNDYNSRLANMYDQIDTLEKKNSVLLRDNEKLKRDNEKPKKKQVIPSGENVAKPLINAIDIDFDVDMAINNLEIVDVKIDTENYVFKDLDPEPPLKRKYEYSEKCLRGDYIAFDLETTGLSPKNDYIIELSAVRFRGFKPVSAFSTLINPVMVDIPANITRITGIHDDDVLGAPMIHQVMQSFTDFVGDDDMVGHNIRAFDLKFLYRFGFEMDESTRNYYDTLSMARKLVPERAVNNNKLETLLDYFGITRSSAHRGLTDSVAEGMLFGKLISQK